MYTDIPVLYLCMIKFACVACMWHWRDIFVSGTYSVIMGGVVAADCCSFGPVCPVMWSSYVYHRSSAMGHTCVMW